MKLFRESLRVLMRHSRRYQPTGNVIPVESVPIPSDSEVATAIEHIRKTGINELQYNNSMQTLRNFADWQEKENLRKRAQSGALAKWKKRNKS
jgi:hypothetical protein